MKHLVSKKSPALSIFNKIKNFFFEMDLIYYASDLAFELGFKTTEELDDALRSAMNICASEGVPIEENFKLVYKYSERKTIVDYKISAFAYKMICLNSVSCNFYVKRMQATFK